MFALLLLALSLVAQAASAQTVTFSGQASAWLASKPDTSPISQTGVRYIPELVVERSLGDSLTATLDLSANGFGTGSYAPGRSAQFEAAAKGYRAWLRVASHTFEARAGLQKINFGSATLFRPLMWFDRVDPRDPLQLTDGVWAILTRYYLGNTNLWGWVLYGNTALKGWETVPTHRGSVEYGARVQAPVPAGELGLSYHHREAHLGSVSGGTVVPEDRVGLDGKWNLGVGLWGEAALVHDRTDLAPLRYQRFWTAGADYTIGVGNGLYALTEYARIDTPASPFGTGNGVGLSGLSLNYPVGVVDKVSGIVYHDWRLDQWYRILDWQRTYDAWTFYLLAFWNPEQVPALLPAQRTQAFAGRGLEVMAVFNH